MFFGLNNAGQEVGTCVDANMITHRLLFDTATQAATNVDDPNGLGTTTISGIDDRGQLVGFYVGGDGNTDGVLVNASAPEPASMAMVGIGLLAAIGHGRRARSKQAGAARARG